MQVHRLKNIKTTTKTCRPAGQAGENRQKGTREMSLEYPTFALSETALVDAVHAASSYILSTYKRCDLTDGIIASIAMRVNRELLILAISRVSKPDYAGFDLSEDLFLLGSQKFPDSAMFRILSKNLLKIRGEEKFAKLRWIDRILVKMGRGSKI